MISNESIKKDLETMEIAETQNLTKGFVTAKYKKLAKVMHPDKPGGNTGEFQELFNAYRRIVKYIEEEINKKCTYEYEEGGNIRKMKEGEI